MLDDYSVTCLYSPYEYNLSSDKGVLILPQSASSDAAAIVSSFINAGVGLDSIEVKTSLTSNDVRLYLGYDALAENGLKIQAINSAVRFGEEQTSVYTFAINPALSNGSINLVNSDYFNVVGKTAVLMKLQEMLSPSSLTGIWDFCLQAKFMFRGAGDVFTSDVLWYVALIAVSLLIGVLIGIIFMRSVKIFEADFAVYRTLGIPNKVSSRSLYVQMALIFLPALVLLPLVSLIATVIQAVLRSFHSAITSL